MGWGILDKLDDALGAAKDALSDVGGSAVGGVKEIALDGVVGLGYDLFVQPYKDASDGNTRWYEALGRGAENVLGDIGHIFGGAFEVVTSPLQAVNVDAPELLNAGYATLDRNAATAEVLLNMAGEGHNPLDRNTWAQAAEIRRRNNLTLGSALMLTAMRGDVRDQQLVDQYMQGRLVTVTARAVDVVAPFLLDPLVIGAKGVGAARQAYVVRPIKATDNLEDLAVSQHVQQFRESIKGLTPAEVVQKYKHKDMDAQTAQVLVHAEREGTFDTAMLALMGHRDAPAFLSQQASTVVANIERLKGQREYLRAGGVIDSPYALTSKDNPHGAYPPVSKQALDDTERELGMWVSQAEHLTRLESRYNTMKNLPHTSMYTEARHAVLRSDWFQNSKTALPLRVVYQQSPKGLLHLDDANGHVQVSNLLDHSALPQEQRLALVNAYLDAPSPADRASVYENVRTQAVESILTKHGITDPDIVAQIMEDMRNGISKADALAKSMSFDGKGRGTVRLHGDGPITELHFPLLNSQNANFLTVPDLVKLDRVARRYADGLRLVTPELGRKIDQVEVVLQRFQQLWKASTLLRVAYPLRVVGEEQVRLIAEYGLMANLKYAGQAVANKIQDYKVIADHYDSEITRFTAMHGRNPNMTEIKQIKDEIETEYYTRHRIRGARQPEYFGVRVQPGLGGDGKVFNSLIDSRALHDESWGRDLLNNDKTINEFITAQRKLRGTGNFEGSISYHKQDGSVDPRWERAWHVAVTRQIANDQAARKILAGATPEEMLLWTRTADGRKYMQQRPGYWRENPEDWIDEVFGHVNDYVPTPALRRAVLDGTLTRKTAHEEFERYGERPIVHGEVLEHVVGHSPIVELIDKITTEGYKHLAQQPTYILSRSKSFDLAYRRELHRMMERHHAQRGGGETIQITDAQLRGYQRHARNEALKETRRLLFDLSTESDLSHSMRFLSPFFNAFEEVVKTWSRLAIHHPTVIPQLHNLWEAPDRAGLVVQDQYGEERIVISLPGDGVDIPGWGKIDNLNLSKRGLNTILNAPGLGPVGTVPVVEITRNRPDIQSSETMRFLFPYGVPADLTAAVTPKLFRNIKTWMDADYQDKQFLSMWKGIYETEYLNYRMGKRATEPTYGEIKDRAKTMAAARIFVDFVAPTQVKFDSPYQSFKDAYARLLAEDPETANQRFYDQYGDALYQLTGSIGKNVAGVPPTLEGWEEFTKHKDLIAAHPEYGSIITGEQAWNGAFNQAVQNWLARTEVGDGSGRNLYRLRTPQEIAEAPRVSAGWLEFNKMMTALYAELDARGLERITDRGAKDLQQLKLDYVRNTMRTKFPEWYDEYTVWDSNSSNKRAEALQAIAESPSLRNRTDIAGLREYLDGRQRLMAELTARKQGGYSGDLRAKENGELRELWEGWVSDLVKRNARFAPLYNRWLDNDHLAVK